MNSSEKKQMWRSYTKSADSVAIRTTYQELKLLLPNYVYIGMVRYINYTSDRLPSLNLFEYITHKHIFYQFENEVRAVAFPPAFEEVGSKHFQENLFELEKVLGFRAFAPTLDIKRAIQEIVFHPESSSKFEEKINNLCANKELTIPRRSQFTSLE